MNKTITEVTMETMPDGRIVILEQDKRERCGRIYRVALPVHVDTRTGKHVNNPDNYNG